MRPQTLKNIFIGFVLLLSCNSNEKTDKGLILKLEKNKEKVNIRITLDDFPITDEMFYNNKGILIDNYTSNSNWFVNDSINQTLVYELYTDKHRMYTYNFINNSFPKTLMNEIPFNNQESKSKGNNITENTFFKFVKNARRINSKYFRTNFGLHIGESKNEIIDRIGDPTSSNNIEKMERLTWGESINRMELYFKNESLIAIFIYRDLI